MIASQDRIQHFYEYAMKELPLHPAITMDELYDRWRMDHPTPEDHAANVAAVKQTMDDLEAGETPMLFDEFMAEFRQRNGQPV